MPPTTNISPPHQTPRPTASAAALVRLEHAAGTPVPTGSLRQWSAQLHGELLRSKRTWPVLNNRLRSLRDDIGRNELRLARVQQLQQETAAVEAELESLVETSARLAHTQRAKSPIEFTAAHALRKRLLDWIVGTRALARAHEEWHSRSLQVDIGGQG